MSSTLTPRQARFIDLYLVDGNGTRAAVAAGYGAAGAAVAANRLLKNAKARAVIEARQGVDSRRLQIDRQTAIQGLLEAVHMAKEQGNPMALVSSWVAIGRLLGLYAPARSEVAISAGGGEDDRRRLEAMSDDELAAVIAA